MAASPTNPMRTGGVLALLAAVTFGATLPAVRILGKDVGPASTAALLYLGAAIATIRVRDSTGASLSRRAGRLMISAFFGAFLAPSLLAWGLQHANGTSASLLLNLEAPFTALFAWWAYREQLGSRALLGLVMTLAGAGTLMFHGKSAGETSILGLAAILGATVSWGLDNTAARPLADQDPNAVIRWKALLGVGFGVIAAFARAERLPTLAAAGGLIVCGGTGYGFSLRLYLMAQRRIGAGRTASIFAVAPFFGAAVAFSVSGEGVSAPTMILAFPLLAVGTYLHLTERHGHRHGHPPEEHSHAHRHDDGHHHHSHQPPVSGEHVHLHHHDALTHEHPHGPDTHHRHSHS